MGCCPCFFPASPRHRGTLMVSFKCLWLEPNWECNRYMVCHSDDVWCQGLLYHLNSSYFTIPHDHMTVIPLGHRMCRPGVRALCLRSMRSTSILSPLPVWQLQLRLLVPLGCIQGTSLTSEGLLEVIGNSPLEATHFRT